MADKYNSMGIGVVPDETVPYSRPVALVDVVYKKVIEEEEYTAYEDDIWVDAVSIPTEFPAGYRVIGIYNVANSSLAYDNSELSSSVKVNLNSNYYLQENTIVWDDIVKNGEIPDGFNGKSQINLDTAHVYFLEKVITYMLVPIEIIPDGYQKRDPNDLGIVLDIYDGSLPRAQLMQINTVYAGATKSAQSARSNYLTTPKSQYSDVVPSGYHIACVGGLNITNKYYTGAVDATKEDENNNTYCKFDKLFTNAAFIGDGALETVTISKIEAREASENYRYMERTVVYIAVPTECLSGIIIVGEYDYIPPEQDTF